MSEPHHISVALLELFEGMADQAAINLRGATACIDAIKEKTMDPKVKKLGDEIKALSPPDRLRVAAELLEKRQARLAKTIIDLVADELGAALLLGRGK